MGLTTGITISELAGPIGSRLIGSLRLFTQS
jgi:hypothetical protein